MSEPKRILLLSANPTGTGRRVDKEMQVIKEGLKRAKQREQFVIESAEAVTHVDLGRKILEFRPNIVHFSGGGEGEKGLVFDDGEGRVKLITSKALAGLFKLFADTVECVVLNACYSQVQAGAIASHIPYVVGMGKEIEDEAAIKFAIAFYDALGAGTNYEFAFNYACNAIDLAGIPESDIPKLLKGQKTVAKNQNSYLVLQIETSGNVLNGEQRYLLQAWFDQDNDGVPERFDISGELKNDNYSKQELKAVFTELIRKCRQRVKNGSLVIECFVTRELLSLDFECWEYEEYKDDTQLKRVFPVHIRCATRLEYPLDLKLKWQTKWKNIQAKLEPLDVHQDREAVNDPERYFSQDTTLWANLCTSSEKDLDQLFKKVLKFGIPVAIWSRCHRQPSHRGDINDLIAECKGNIFDLPSQVRVRRNNAPSKVNEDSENLGHHLSLLWDDPDRLPPIGDPYTSPNP